MYCPQCGFPVGDQDSFCQHCGATLKEEAGYNFARPCPRTYLALSIVCTAMCCLPFGLIGILSAIDVSSNYQKGLYDEAEKASRRARSFSIAGIICSAVIALAWIALLIWAGVSGLDIDDVITSI